MLAEVAIYMDHPVLACFKFTVKFREWSPAHLIWQ